VPLGRSLPALIRAPMLVAIAWAVSSGGCEMRPAIGMWLHSVSAARMRAGWAIAALLLAGCTDPATSAGVPNFAKPQKILWPDQGWDAASANWFHHADQGTQTFLVPYEWFVALEQPGVSVKSLGLLSSPDYLDRYGFIPDEKPDALPIGFAHGGAALTPSGTPWTNPQTGAALTSVGLTCAACHTGRLTYNGTEIRVDGAPANTNLKEFQGSLVLALLETAASFFSAQMVAMRNATENANELVESLSLTYNKVRQANITREVLEIASAAEAMAASSR